MEEKSKVGQIIPPFSVYEISLSIFLLSKKKSQLKEHVQVSQV